MPGAASKPKTHSSLPLGSLRVPETPRHRHSLATPGLTPTSLGVSALQKQEGDSDRIEKYDSGDYDDYIRVDLGCRVFVDYNVFLKRVVHAPDDWETRWKPAIDAVKADGKFNRHHKDYCGLCDKGGTLEVDFYPALTRTANAILDVLTRTEFEGIPCERRQYYHVNNPTHIKGGVINKRNLSPDLVVLHNSRDRPCPVVKESLHWANPLHVLEVKPYDNALSDGRNMPRLAVDGIDPLEKHAAAPAIKRYRAKKDPFAVATETTVESQSGSASRKRAADHSSTPDPRDSKKPKTDKDSTSDEVEEEKEGSPPSELKQQREPALQVCRYLLEMFSVPLLRSHATVSLVDRDRLQLYHANRSVILVSSAINFSKGDGMVMFIATIIAFHCLTFEQNGVLETRVPGNPGLVSRVNFPPKPRHVQKNNELILTGPRKPFKVTLGEVICRDPAVVGRSTSVFNATSDRWRNKPLVVKISWPTSGRVSETELIKHATGEAKGTHSWAKCHLPKVYHAEDIAFDGDSTLESVARLFDEVATINGEYVYERRTLRVIVEERLSPLRSLGSVRDIGQVLLDVACVHHWLYKHAGILHRDLSISNIMYRLSKKKKKGKGRSEMVLCGVLTDYDLSSWTEDLKGDYKRTSQQRTGTPPYMAHELLDGSSSTHLYRHDLESLFYIMLLIGARHTIGTPKGEEEPRVVMRESGLLPYQDWFKQQRYPMLGSLKCMFFLNTQPIMLSPVFEDFRPWLQDLQLCFSAGIKQRPSPNEQVWAPWRAAIQPTTPKFDNETLGGFISYSTFLTPVPHLTGELKGLSIRGPKPPPSSTPPASAGAT